MSETGLESVAIKLVSKRFGYFRALDKVSTTLEPGKPCVLLGPNGAGKSTLLGIVSTLMRPTRGKVVFQRGNGELLPDQARSAIGVVAHDSLVYGELTAIENLELYAGLYEVPNAKGRARSVLEEMGLEKAAWERPASTYSRGMMQRLSLARALLHKPSLLLLDEPFTGLDESGVRAVQDLVKKARQANHIVLIVTHNASDVAELGQQLVILRRGRIVYDVTRDQPFGDTELRELYQQHTETA